MFFYCWCWPDLDVTFLLRNDTKDFLKEQSVCSGLVNIPREMSFTDVINDGEHDTRHLRLAPIHQQELTTPLEMTYRKPTSPS